MEDVAPAETAAGTDDELVPADQLRLFTERIFASLGMVATDAALLADHLIWAELRGPTLMGLHKVPQYVARLRAGGTKATGEITVVADRGSLVVVDGDDMFGQVVGARATLMSVDRARAHGIGAVVVRNTTSAGALGYYPMLAAKERMVGLAVNNTPPVMAPAGGRGKVMGVQPFAVASPTGEPTPVILDMTNATLSMSGLDAYRRRGSPLPPDVALDSQGRPTVDPVEAMRGIALPMAGHRGSGLALMLEILTGVLAGGSRFASDVTMPDELDRRQGTSLFHLAIDPTVAMSEQEFTARVDRVVDEVRSSPPAPGVAQVRTPGERGSAAAAERERTGVPLSSSLAETLKRLGEELGVPWT